MRIRGKDKPDYSEVRRKNLILLVELYGSMPKLNLALGRKRNDTALSQIKNEAFNKTKKTPRRMGNAIAREIEYALNLKRGWMDEEHPDAFPRPVEKLINALPPPSQDDSEQTNNSPKDFKEDQKEKEAISNIPLYELDSERDPGVKSIPISVGEIIMPNAFLTLVPNLEHKSEIQAFYMKDNSLNKTIPYGSIVLVDTSVKKFTKDGIYLVKVKGNTIVRKIVLAATGGFFVLNDLNPPEKVETLEEISIFGLCVGGWEPRIF